MATNNCQLLRNAHASTTLNDPAGGAENTAPPFASLTPVNALAKMAFSDVFEATGLSGQKTQNDGNGGPPRMVVQDEQRYDADVARFRMEEERGRETSERLTEPDTDAEASSDGGLGMMWTGRYVFTLHPVPSATELRWTVRKGTTEQAPWGDLL